MIFDANHQTIGSLYHLKKDDDHAHSVVLIVDHHTVGAQRHQQVVVCALIIVIYLDNRAEIVRLFTVWDSEIVEVVRL